METENHMTSTCQWSLVVQRVTDKSVKVWVGTLFPTLKMPEKARVILTLPDGSTRIRRIGKSDWCRPFRKMEQRFYTVTEFKNLGHSEHYELSFDRQMMLNIMKILTLIQKREGLDRLIQRIEQKNIL